MSQPWSGYRKCEVCFAETGEACFELSSGGPQAIPEVRSAVPHSSRNLRTAGTPGGAAKVASVRPAYLRPRTQ